MFGKNGFQGRGGRGTGNENDIDYLVETMQNQQVGLSNNPSVEMQGDHSEYADQR